MLCYAVVGAIAVTKEDNLLVVPTRAHQHLFDILSPLVLAVALVSIEAKLVL